MEPATAIGSATKGNLRLSLFLRASLATMALASSGGGLRAAHQRDLCLGIIS